ncbi:MAG: MarR family transcriptional regulator [Candidatus Sumerlaeaceae bacterium]|nr:MarR family transcriptional regulator [Candidatus Sumerlaeaceae bacterium]
MTTATAKTSETVHEAIAALQRLAEAFFHRREQLARDVGLSVEQWRVLEEISDEHFMPSMFARERRTSAAAVSKVIRQLIEKGLVVVGVSETDGRQRDYTLTIEGRRAMARLRTARQEAIAEVWGGLKSPELVQFAKLSASIADRMEAYADKSD